MKLVFAGTPEFASIALQRLLQAGFDVPLVLTQPDRPAGRGLRLQPSPVKLLALDHGIQVAQPRSLRLDGKYPEDAAATKWLLEDIRPDAMIVAAYGLILPPWTLELPRQGCFNIHASLLPRWRGAAPIHRAIEAGDAETGVTIMQMDAGLDTGDMLLRESLPIAADDNTARLHDRLAALGARLMVEALELLACGGLTRTPQSAEGVTYAHKIEKAEAAIDWTLAAEVLARRVRAFDPFPGALTQQPDGASLKVWAASAVPGTGVPGTVLAVSGDGVDVACGQGVLRLTELQRAGGKRLPVADFLRGSPLVPGQLLGAACS